MMNASDDFTKICFRHDLKLDAWVLRDDEGDRFQKITELAADRLPELRKMVDDFYQVFRKFGGQMNPEAK